MLATAELNGQRKYSSNIWKFYLTEFLANLSFFAGVLIPFFTEWGGISYSRAFMLQSFFVLFIFLLEVPTGAIADYLGRKQSILLGTAINVIAILIYASYPNFWIFVFGEFLWALACALYSGADQALIYDSLKETGREKESKKVFGSWESFRLLGMFAAAPVGSYLVQHIGLRGVMTITAIPMLFSFFVILTLKEPKKEIDGEKKSYIGTIVDGFVYFKNHKVLRNLAFDTISITVLSFLLIWVYQPLLIELGIPIFYFGFVHAGIVLMQLLFLNSFSNLEILFGSRKKYLLGSALLAGFGYLMIGLASNMVLIVFGILLIAGFGLTRNVLFNNYMNKHIESSNRATVLSTISMIRRLAGGIMYIIVGFTIEWSITYTLVGLGMLMIASALVARTQEDDLLD